MRNKTVNHAETLVFRQVGVQGNYFPAGVLAASTKCWSVSYCEAILQGKVPKKVYLDYLTLLRYNGKEQIYNKNH